MPDWVYRTVARRPLFGLSPAAGRRVALGVIGALGRSRSGGAIIGFLGHMEPDPRVAAQVAATALSSRIGLGWRVDPECRATRGLSRFGIGCVEVRRPAVAVVRTAEGLEDSSEHLRQSSNPHPTTLPLLVRSMSGDIEQVRMPDGATLRVVGIEDAITQRSGFAGVLLQAGTRLSNGRWRVPVHAPPEFTGRAAAWRRSLGPTGILIVSGGVAQPSDAVALIDAGVDLVLIDAGLVFQGPGLYKRCNMALLRRAQREAMPPPAQPATSAAGAVRDSIFREAWLWAAGLGTALGVGGVATLWLAFTRVLLPYDEQFIGLSSAALHRTLPRVFAFMAHDRGTLAGTMLGLGAWYGVIGYAAIRRGVHGARTAILSSALVGFASFFAFFGFDYFDPLHAFVAAVLFQLTIQIATGHEPAPEAPRHTEDEDPAWRRAQWGQLLFVIHAVGLLIAGTTILLIGMTRVFVSEDLSFLCVTRAEALQLGAQMTGVIAHDRATLGGMLLAAGVAMLLPVLWCYERGAAWLWRGLLLLGLPAYGAALTVHAWVGYNDPRHIAPALAGLALWAAGLALSGSYLRDNSVPHA